MENVSNDVMTHVLLPYMTTKDKLQMWGTVNEGVDKIIEDSLDMEAYLECCVDDDVNALNILDKK